MPLKIPPFTPVPIQPTSAEPFSTFVQQTPLAQTPLAGTELIPVIQGGVSKHTPPGSIGSSSLKVGTTPVTSGTSGFALTDNAGVLGDTPIRTILTANTNYYVAVGGSDSANGLSPATAWATLQHAINVISETIDFAAFTIVLNLGAGTFEGAIMNGSVGSGTLQIVGAGSGSTRIGIAADSFDIDSATATLISINACRLTGVFTCFGAFAPGSNIRLGDSTGGGALNDLIFSPAGGGFGVFAAFNSTFNVASSSGSLVMDNSIAGATAFTGIYLYESSSAQDFGVWTLTGNPNFGDQTTPSAFIFVQANSSYVFFGSTSGVFSGLLVLAAAQSSFSGGALGLTSAFLADPSSSLSLNNVEGFMGIERIAGAPTTALITTNTEGVFKDTNQGTATKGLSLFGNDAGTIFPLTALRTTFANLPATPHQGDMASISDGKAANCGDASCTTFGTSVTGGGGALNLLIWYNGTNWTLMGK